MKFSEQISYDDNSTKSAVIGRVAERGEIVLVVNNNDNDNNISENRFISYDDRRKLANRSSQVFIIIILTPSKRFVDRRWRCGLVGRIVCVRTTIRTRIYDVGWAFCLTFANSIKSSVLKIIMRAKGRGCERA